MSTNPEKNNEYEIIMSPTLSTQLNSINNNYNSLIEKVDKINNYLVENRNIYLEMLKQINEVSKKNCQILEENRKMYTKCLNEIKDAEQQNMEEIRPILDNMNLNNKKLEENISNYPLQQSRVYNRFWRSAVPSKYSNIILPLNLDPPFMKELNLKT